MDPPHIEIDAGVIFGDRSGYLCIPLSRLGISSSESIEAIASSCECVKSSLVRYSESSTTTADGVLLDFTPDELPDDTTPQSTPLGVVVTFSIVGGGTQAVTLNFLHTRIDVMQ